jgi:hypothetical protein
MIPTTTHVLSISSAQRDVSAYPDPGQYQIQLPQRYKNIWSAQLLNISIPELTPPQFNIFLDIDKLNMIDSTSPSGGTNFCVARIPLYAPYANIFFIDALTSSFMDIPLQNPIASMDKLSIKIKDINGNVLTLTKNHSFQLQLTCGDYVTNGGGSSIKGTARYLGGTQ